MSGKRVLINKVGQGAIHNIASLKKILKNPDPVATLFLAFFSLAILTKTVSLVPILVMPEQSQLYHVSLPKLLQLHELARTHCMKH